MLLANCPLSAPDREKRAVFFLKCITITSPTITATAIANTINVPTVEPMIAKESVVLEESGVLDAKKRKEGKIYA